MKKLSTIIIAIALVLGLGQCKKQETPATPTNDDGMVYITVNVGDNGGKHTVYPNHGLYGFDNGDILYVGNNGHFVGTLEYQDGAFSGGIQSPSTNDYLHFYFLGGKTPAVAPTKGETTDFTINIADQSGNLPLLSYGHSTKTYTNEDANYSTTLRNKCALVKFGLTNAASDAITVAAGLLTEATVNFATSNPGITPTETTGSITLYNSTTGESNERWAILLPGTTFDEASNVTVGENVPEIANNGYITSGITVANPITGTINGLFSVSDSKQVYFSQGNLQYIGSASTPYWKFAENQWDYLGTTSGQDSYAANVDRDLFGWGTSGYNHGASSYQPWETSNSYNRYYAYGNQNYNLYDGSGQADWGYNPIANGGNHEDRWRTLTNAEWYYVFNTRTDAAYKKGHGKVNGVNGMILLPDEWTLPEGLGFTYGNSNWANVYNAEQWAQMEANGAVFLPAAGYRNGTSLNSVGEEGQYWSSSHGSNYYYAYYMFFYSNGLNSQENSYRNNGCSVRLVRKTE